MSNSSLEIVQGIDKNGIYFSAFILCKTEEDKNKLNECILNKNSSLDEFNIVYKMIGHIMTLPQSQKNKIIKDVIDYIKIKKMV